MIQIPQKLGRLVNVLSLGMNYRELWFEAEEGTISFVSIRWNEKDSKWEVVSTTQIGREAKS